MAPAKGMSLNSLENFLKISSEDANMITAIMNYLIPLAYALIVIYFLIDIIEKSTSLGRSQPLDWYIGAFLKLIISISVIKYGYQIIGWACDLGNAGVNATLHGSLVNIASGGENSLEEYLKNLEAEIKSLGLLESIFMLLSASLVEILGVVASAMLILHTVSRKIEIIIRGGFSVLAFPDIFTQGLNSNCIRFIKKFAALTLQGMAFVLILKISEQLQMNYILNSFNQSGVGLLTAVTPILFTFAAIGMFSATKGVINDALGA